MAFKKMSKPKYPPRHWSIVGYAGSGKSTFAAQMRGPKLVVDSDHRFTEVLDLNNDDVYQLSDNKSDNADPDRIARLMYSNMPGSDVQTIVVDSLTAIISPLTIQAMIDKEKGRSKNMMSGFKEKALAMRQLIDAIMRWGTDCLWIYHIHDARDGKAKEITTTTVSQTEIARLLRCINAQLEVVQEGNKRGIKVVWSRSGRSNIVLWDESGNWEKMPERIEAALYDGLTQEEQNRIEAKTPIVFQSPQHALSYGVEEGAFQSIEEAQKQYELVKKECQPANAKEMAEFWQAEIRQRKSNMGVGQFGSI
jgi:energy-coupling factor transporter ATP-binding protein EcfA2